MIITRRIQAVLSAIGVALLVGFGSVSADDSVDPSKDICITSEIENGTKVSMNVVDRWYGIFINYDERNGPDNPNVTPPYTLDQFHNDLDRWLTAPEMINCYAPMNRYIENFPIHWTFVHALAEHGGSASNDAAIEAAKWAVSKGYDLNLKVITLSNDTNYKLPSIENKNAYEIANAGLKRLEKWKHDFKRRGHPIDMSSGEKYIVYGKLVEILNPTPPRAATKTCAEVDGQTPPANEYCIIAENVQSSRRIAITGTEA
ncbi:MAG: hypothetical protein ISN28_15590 [Ectothiorhodospiraceae bacterium AqS1]|nr:hypothetical protein [Ectothiorhodospiraceae bacterium AqS1]MBF2761655.1 hypothetical protein [Ectothiorhodospiraceae bacterium AqS1]